MKVLWFTNLPLPDLSGLLGREPVVVGGWVPSLFDELRQRGDIELAAATAVVGQEQLAIHRSKGATYYCLPRANPGPVRWTPAFAAACEKVVGEYVPDVIHVHGTEEAYGLVTGTEGLAPRTVVSIQGLIHVCSRYMDGGLGIRDASRGGSAGLVSWARYLIKERDWWRRGEVERKVLRANRNFIGRTAWDKAHLLAVNHSARYFECGELLRPPFFQRHWDEATSARPRVFCTAAHSPLKGFHFLLEAVAILRPEYPDIRVRVASAPWNAERGIGCYGRFIKELIGRLGLTNNIVPLPSLSAEQVADELAKANVFAIPSLVENSPNSLGEAMLVGTPCVAAFAGGIPSLIDDGATALAFPPGDSAYLAHCLRRVFSDGSLAQRLSANAREVASKRYNPSTVVTDQLGIYRAITSGNGS